MMSRMFGAPFGGTTRGGHHGTEPCAVCLITPPNFGGGFGTCAGSRVVVAFGAPGVPVRCVETIVAFADLTDSLGDRASHAVSASADATTVRVEPLKCDMAVLRRSHWCKAKPENVRK